MHKWASLWLGSSATAALCAIAAILPAHAHAQDAGAAKASGTTATEHILVIKNHRYEPAEITVPVGQKIKLMVHNQDDTPEEFESHDLNREKVIPGGAKAVIFIGPLKAGRYVFVGEYHEVTAKGVVIAK